MKCIKTYQYNIFQSEADDNGILCLQR